MVTEAVQLNADGIVGVDLRRVGYAGAGEVLEFLAVGTAVRFEKAPGSFRAPSGKPFSSDLSGRDFFKLLRYGWAPPGWSWAAASSTSRTNPSGSPSARSARTWSYPVHAGDLRRRELAMARMQSEGERDGAAGIVGVRVEESNQVWASMGGVLRHGTGSARGRGDRQHPAPGVPV